MPMLLAKREVFEWLLQGRKTIDVRKGKPQQGETVLFISGPRRLKLRVVGVQSGKLSDLIVQDNFRQVIPTAATVDEAIGYLRRIYGVYDGVFTAYMVVP